VSQAKSVKQVLQAARWIIQNVGWCQNTFFKNKKGNHIYDISSALKTGNVGCACASGAIKLVQTNESLREDARLSLHKVVDYPSVPIWNDTPGRTKEEVLEAFDKAIARAGQQ
jgi:hypothetical protein